ncbi:hypothetical protein [Rossellomorea aquimaris]|uniref:hypothetical protein n=1 Tax=Rossellomorea aquimaris TaxID=189382 RepID=UPI0011E91871|nr:hypothetical protein [Rossellomorea aquimaris]TYS91914.1 hypothetical protein FZC88_07205 [Rossellomorea aquimaris]
MIVVIGCFVIGLLVISVMGLLVGMAFGLETGGEVMVGILIAMVIPLIIGIYEFGQYIASGLGLM